MPSGIGCCDPCARVQWWYGPTADPDIAPLPAACGQTLADCLNTNQSINQVDLDANAIGERRTQSSYFACGSCSSIL